MISEHKLADKNMEQDIEGKLGLNFQKKSRVELEMNFGQENLIQTSWDFWDCDRFSAWTATSYLRSQCHIRVHYIYCSFILSPAFTVSLVFHREPYSARSGNIA